MVTMIIKAWKSENHVTVEVRDVALKYYTFKEDIVDNLYKIFKTDQPNRILLEYSNQFVDMFLDKLIDEGYLIDRNGYIKYISEWTEIKNTVLKNGSQDNLELDFKSIQEQFLVTELLLKNGYTVTLSKIGNVYKVNTKNIK